MNAYAHDCAEVLRVHAYARGYASLLRPLLRRVNCIRSWMYDAVPRDCDRQSEFGLLQF